tara:strand:+ start:125 stop:346 length:222 start_codon:yes stop_codon:yes gene_type:complete
MKNGRFNWMDPNDVEVKACSICEGEIYDMGSNPQPVIHNGIKLKVTDTCCNSCNAKVVMPLRLTPVNNRKDLN